MILLNPANKSSTQNQATHWKWKHQQIEFDSCCQIVFTRAWSAAQGCTQLYGFRTFEMLEERKSNVLMLQFYISYDCPLSLMFVLFSFTTV